MSILDKITSQKRIEVEHLKRTEPLEKFQELIDKSEAISFTEALSSENEINIIAEIKKGSPSKGIIRQDFNPIYFAKQYKKGGAAALSVLTESNFFFGHHQYIALAKKESGLPVLCKDFIIDPYQIYYAHYKKADAILLIVSILSEILLKTFIQLSERIGIAAIVEVHDQAELDIALNCNPKIIGVNNRNLADFSVSLETAEKLAEHIPADIIKIAESGIFTYDDITRLKNSGYNNFLIGESLMRSDNPSELIISLRGL